MDPPHHSFMRPVLPNWSVGGHVKNMKELHDERLDIHVLSVCSVVCNVQVIEVIRKNLW
jgi:hypothetical protein